MTDKKFPKILDHSSHVLFPFNFPIHSSQWVRQHLIERIESLTLENVLPELKLPEQLYKRISSGADMAMRVWQEAATALSGDLHEHLRRLIDPVHPRDDEMDIFLGHKPCEISSELMNILSGDWGRFGEGLEIPVSKSASLRLGSDEKYFIPCWIEEIKLYLFGTGVGIVAALVRYQKPGKRQEQPEPLHIIEGNYVCGRTRKQPHPLRWQQVEQEAFTLDDLVRALVPALKKRQEDIQTEKIAYDWNRLFIYTSVHLAQPVGDNQKRSELAFRLSRKYTQAYLPNKEILNKGLFSPFANIVHGFAIEGGVLISEAAKDDQGNEIDFLREFPQNTLFTVYFPLCLIAYQEYLALIDFLQGEKRIHFDPYHYSSEMLKKVKQYQMQLLRFRLLFGFSEASKISMHNDVYKTWQNCFSLHELLGEVTEDVKKIEAFINDEHSKRQKKISNIQTFGAIWISAFIFLTGFFGMNFFDFTKLELCKISFFSTPIIVTVITTIIVFIFAGGCAAWYYGKNMRDQ